VVDFYWMEAGKLAGSHFPKLDELKELYTLGFRILVPRQVREDIGEIEKLGFDVHPIFMPDFSSPTIQQLEEFNSIVARSDGKPILVHCLAGYGRTGTMLAAYLMKFQSLNADEAIRKVRAVRPGAVEVDNQVAMLKEYEHYL